MAYAYQPTLEWVKCEGNQWCNLFTVNLAHPHFAGLQGVYVIWHGGQNAKTVYVGQGVIADRLAAHRQEPAITSYAALGLFVTWAQVDRLYQDGVELYLSNALQPLVGGRHPQAMPVAVNLPW